MNSTSYLRWFRRLLILGAVVAGLSASAAAARVDPGLPDVTSSMSAMPTAIWEHQLHSPGTSQYPTAAGLKADGLRWQGIARVYEQQSASASGGSDSALSNWEIGVGAGLGLVLVLGVGLVVGRQQRHRMQPA
jgi:hypothetical protein